MRTPVYNTVDEFTKDNKLSDTATNFIANLVQQLQVNLPDDGYVIPDVDEGTLSKLRRDVNSDGRRNPAYYRYKLVYDNTADILRINNAKGGYLGIQTKLMTKWDSTKPWVDTTTGMLTMEAQAFLDQFVEENK